MSEPNMSSAKNSNAKSINSLLSIALRLLWRDWRGGELKLLFIALVMAVTSVTGIALFTDRLEKALLLESANMLAADRVLWRSRPVPPEIVAEAQSQGLQTAETLTFTSMAFSDTGNMLVSAKAVTDTYPLRGELIVTEQAFTRGTPTVDGPTPGEAWLESRAIAALDLSVGDLVYVGETELRVSNILVTEPDRQQGGIIDNAGPRLLLHMDDVAATNVVQLGSRVNYRYLFAGEIDLLDSYTLWLADEYDEEYRLRDVRDESEEISEALNSAESFLLLGSLSAVLLAGIAIALTAKRYSERHFDYVAILKTLGCTSNEISFIYFSSQLALAFIAIIVGSGLGWLVHEVILSVLSSVLQVELPAASFEPFVIGSLTALVCLLSFALPPLLALRHTPVLRVLRKDMSQQKLSDNVPYIFGLSGALFLVFWYSQELLLTSILVLAVALIAVLLSFISYVLLRSSSSVGMRAGSAWKLAMTAARRRRKQNVLQVMVFSTTIMALLILTLLRTDLISEWQAQLPEGTPNHFMMNISDSQIEGMEQFFDANGIAANQFYPLVSARIMSINDAEPVVAEGAEIADTPGSLTERAGAGPDGDEEVEADTASAAQEDEEEGQSRGGSLGRRQITWAENLPNDNQVVDGDWWDEEIIPGYVSVEQSYASSLGIEIGDQIEVEINQQRVFAQVQSLRTVRWDNMQPNFFLIFSPGTMDNIGATYLSTALLEREQKVLLNDLVRQFPTIVVLEIDGLIEQIQTIVAQVTSAIELISVLVLVCGGLVLLSCVNATLDERFHENAILRTLGAGKKLILNSLFIEFASIGFIAGIIATLGAEASLYFLQTEIFEQEFSLHPWVWIAGPLLGMVIIAGLGVNSTRRVVEISPLNVLRRLV